MLDLDAREHGINLGGNNGFFWCNNWNKIDKSEIDEMKENEAAGKRKNK